MVMCGLGGDELRTTALAFLEARRSLTQTANAELAERARVLAGQLLDWWRRMPVPPSAMTFLLPLITPEAPSGRSSSTGSLATLWMLEEAWLEIRHARLEARIPLIAVRNWHLLD